MDAETAARSVLAGQSTAIPKTADGAVEMMRHLKVARRTAVKARTSAMITLKQIVVTAPPRASDPPPARRPGAPHTLPRMALRHDRYADRLGETYLRALARRWFALAVEIVDHDRHLGRLTTQTSPTLREGFGIGADTAAELLIIFGDNPERIHSEAAFAKLCGLPHPGFVRDDDGAPPPLPRRSSTGQRRAPPGRHRADAVPHTHPQLRRTTHC